MCGHLVGAVSGKLNSHYLLSLSLLIFTLMYDVDFNFHASPGSEIVSDSALEFNVRMNILVLHNL